MRAPSSATSTLRRRESNPPASSRPLIGGDRLACRLPTLVVLRRLVAIVQQTPEPAPQSPQGIVRADRYRRGQAVPRRPWRAAAVRAPSAPQGATGGEPWASRGKGTGSLRANRRSAQTSRKVPVVRNVPLPESTPVPSRFPWVRTTGAPKLVPEGGDRRSPREVAVEQPLANPGVRDQED